MFQAGMLPGKAEAIPGITRDRLHRNIQVLKGPARGTLIAPHPIQVHVAIRLHQGHTVLLHLQVHPVAEQPVQAAEAVTVEEAAIAAEAAAVAADHTAGAVHAEAGKNLNTP